MERYAATWRKIISLTLLPFVTGLVLCVIVYITSSGNRVLADYRVFRAYYALVSGGVLGATGAVLQASLKNPLVDHYILGIGSGALFATQVSILLFGYNPAIATTTGVIGGLVALGLTLIIAEMLSGSDIAYVLSGTGVTMLFSGLATFTSYFTVSKYPHAFLLLVGSFVIVDREKLVYTMIPVILLIAGYVYSARRLNALMINDDFARQLGIDPGKTRLVTVVVSGVSASIIVSLFGLIGFVGLVTPHIARFILKTGDNRLVIPLSSTLGMVLTYLTDQFSRLVASAVWSEVPAGSIISLIGAPFFLALLVSRFTGGRSD